MNKLLISLSFLAVFHSSVGQSRLTDDMKATEAQLSASNKQINQFFRRFNGEEDGKGKRLFPGDKKYQDISLRKKYIPNLFDQKTNSFSSDEIKKFLKKVLDKERPSLLDFHNDDWFAEVNADFLLNGKKTSGLLYLKLQKQGLGYEWIIEDVAFDVFQNQFDKDTSESKRFMHPMSHELGFMTLKKALQDEDHTEQFTARNYQPDFLTLFLYELNQGNLTFQAVKNVKFHFFSVDGWYFSIANFNRPGYNSGWLISNLVAIPSETMEKQLKDYIYNRN